MEFLRFGSSIPGSYWGCCAVCIIQNFNFDPDAPASIELVSGDGGYPIIKNQEAAFLGKTYKEIFLQRLRMGTFGAGDMPNHAFLAVLTQDQLSTQRGLQWLKLLKENGFEFIRTVGNSVYSGDSLHDGTTPEYTPEDSDDDWDEYDDEYYEGENSHPNYLFGLFRNIGASPITDPFKPPQQWLDLEGGVKEIWNTVINDSEVLESTNVFKYLQDSRDTVHLSQWDKIGRAQFFNRQELIDAGVPVTLAGLRSPNPQELEEFRKLRQEQAAPVQKAASAPW